MISTTTVTALIAGIVIGFLLGAIGVIIGYEWRADASKEGPT